LDAKRDLPGNDVGHQVPEAGKSDQYEHEHSDVFPKMAFIEGAFSSHFPAISGWVAFYFTLVRDAMAVPWSIRFLRACVRL
jgi:hypothetical protein